MIIWSSRRCRRLEGGDNEEVGAAPPPVQPPSASSGRDDVEMDASAAAGGGAVSGDAPDDASPDDDGLVVDDTAAPKKKARITDAAKAALHKYFSDSNWSRNKKMPKQNGDMGLDNIINEFGLERSQASRQLRLEGYSLRKYPNRAHIQPREHREINLSMHVDGSSRRPPFRA